MLEGGVLLRVLTGGVVRTLGVSDGASTSVSQVSAEDTIGLLVFLSAGRALADVVEGLLAHLLVATQDADDECSAVDGDAVSPLFTNESGTDMVLVAASEQHRTVGVEGVGILGLIALRTSDLGEPAAVRRHLVAWTTWGGVLTAVCLTKCSELPNHSDQRGPHAEVSAVMGHEEQRFSTTCLLFTRLGVSRTRANQMADHGWILMSMGFAPVEAVERCGVLDLAKALLVARHLEDAPTLATLVVQNKALPQAPGRSASQVGRDPNRALVEIDPGDYAGWSQNNTKRWYVSCPRPAGESFR